LNRGADVTGVSPEINHDVPVAAPWNEYAERRALHLATVIGVPLPSLVAAEVGRVEEQYIRRIASQADVYDSTTLLVTEILM